MCPLIHIYCSDTKAAHQWEGPEPVTNKKRFGPPRDGATKERKWTLNFSLEWDASPVEAHWFPRQALCRGLQQEESAAIQRKWQSFTLTMTGKKCCSMYKCQCAWSKNNPRHYYKYSAATTLGPPGQKIFKLQRYPHLHGSFSSVTICTSYQFCPLKCHYSVPATKHCIYSFRF